MKTALDPRHLKRIQHMQALFAHEFADATEAAGTPEAAENAEILKKLPEIDQKIAQAAPQWPLDQINKVDLAILRISVFELLYTDTPPKVVMDEAIELAKEFGAEQSPKFVNGVLAHIAANR